MCFLFFSVLLTNVNAWGPPLHCFWPIASSLPSGPLSLRFPGNVTRIFPLGSISSLKRMVLKKECNNTEAYPTVSLCLSHSWHRLSSWTSPPGPRLLQDNPDTDFWLLNQIKQHNSQFSLYFLILLLTFKFLHQSVNKSLWNTLPGALRWDQKKY